MHCLLVASLRLGWISGKHGFGFHWRSRSLIDTSFISTYNQYIRYIYTSWFKTISYWINDYANIPNHTSATKRDRWSDRTTSASHQCQGFCHLQVIVSILYPYIKKYREISCFITCSYFVVTYHPHHHPYHQEPVWQYVLIFPNILNISVDLKDESGCGETEVTADLMFVYLQTRPEPRSDLAEQPQVSRWEVPPAPQYRQYPSASPSLPSRVTWNSVAPGWRTLPGWRRISEAGSS